MERDSAALNSAEDLDEDRAAAVECGGQVRDLPYEQAHPRPLSDRLAEEQPGGTPAAPQPSEVDSDGIVEPEPIPELVADVEAEALTEAVARGQAADAPDMEDQSTAAPAAAGRRRKWPRRPA